LSNCYIITSIFRTCFKSSKPAIPNENPGAIEPVSVKSIIATSFSAVCKISPESDSVPSSPHSTKNEISDYLYFYKLLLILHKDEIYFLL
jgi:hypothetical protein